ncbi:O-antigen ligase family protein [Ideonella sp. 4Y16]|uniref:O-antigen ligase family protein n=1 Tax=Ideonella alba TaxID=2824118 RepID=UPI001B359A12|nr:O-antigen ligase family protein [Ideonella alba]MBQ0943130.1 O-antigen ligase family protein [Ideonella alba]
MTLPVLLGGNRAWAVGLAVLAAWGLLCLGAWQLWRTPGTGAALRDSGAPRAVLPLAALAGLALLVAAQVLTAGLGLDSAVATADPFKTHDYLLRTLLYGAAFALVLLAVRSDQAVIRLLVAFVTAGLLQAFLGAALLSTGKEFWLLHTPFDHYGRASGTFPNADHLAGFMELCLSAGLGLMVSQFGGDSGPQQDGWRGRALDALRFALSPKMLLRMLLVVLVIALVLTRSRMGNAAFFISLLAVGALVAWRSAKLRRPALWLVASMVVIDIFVIGQLVGLEKVVTRLQGTDIITPGSAAASGVVAAPELSDKQRYREESLQQRLTPAIASLELVWQRPWLGWGGGSFESVFPSVRSAQVIPYQFDYAHSDYAQQAVEVGLLGLALWLLVGVLALWRALRLLADDQPRLHRGVAVSTLMALGCLGLHSVVDFNLQIPANALAMTVLLALPFTLPLKASRRRSGRGQTADADASSGAPAQQGRTLGQHLGLALPLLVALWLVPQAARTLWADWLAAPSWGLLSRPTEMQGKYRVVPTADIDAAIARLQRAQELTPDSPEIQHRLGHFLLLRAGRLPQDDPQQQALLQQAQAHFALATQARPHDPRPWLGEANVRYFQGDVAGAWALWNKARERGPQERAVLHLAMDMALPTWEDAPADVKQWLANAFDTGNAELRREMNEEAADYGLEFTEE